VWFHREMERRILEKRSANARDLGGLPAGGSLTKRGGYIQSFHLDDLDDDGWRGLLEAGLRTVVDLRGLDEVPPLVLPAGPRAPDGSTGDRGDPAFTRLWARLMDSPVYYDDSLARFPTTIASVFTAFAEAPPGGILFHCGEGRDRSGLIAAMLLKLVGVRDRIIAEDYESAVRALDVSDGSALDPAETLPAAGVLDAWIADTSAELAAFLEGLDVEGFLTRNGLTPKQIAAVRGRLVD